MGVVNPSNFPALSLSQKANRTPEQPISFLIATTLANPNLINLAAGLVDPYTLPAEATAEIVKRILSDRDRARAALQYDTTRGLFALRQTALDHLLELDANPPGGLGLTPEHIVVTTGSQQSLYLVADVLIDPGDIVIAGNPSYFVYTGTLQSLGAKVLAVPMDENGVDVQAVEDLLTHLDSAGQLDRVKLIYCTSYFDNPTGLTLSLERRRKLVEIVQRFSRRHRILIHEDAAYRELRYDGEPLPSIKSFDVDNRFVILSQTFSKPFAPGLKLGYTAMPSDLAAAVIEQKGNHDFGSSNLAQHIAYEAMRDGSYDQHVQVLCDAYRRKRDTTGAALEQLMPGSVGWTRPLGGLYFWLTLPDGINTSRGSRLFNAAVDAGVLYVPGDYCFQPDEKGHIPKNHLRLSFGQVHIDQITPGIEKLAGAVAAELRLIEATPVPRPSPAMA